MTTKLDSARWKDTLELLACDVDSRPAAPLTDELLPFLTSVSRTTETIVVTYDRAAADLFAAFAAAESVCCASLGWSVDETASTLTVTASPTQLDALQEVFATK
ncbi:MAG: hypothetical protein ABIP13_00995 [Tepidiformaceae bacterium]